MFSRYSRVVAVRRIVLAHVAEPARELGQSLAVGALADPVHGQMLRRRERGTREDGDLRLEVVARGGGGCGSGHVGAACGGMAAKVRRRSPVRRASRRFIEQREAGARVRPLPLHARERRASGLGQRRQRRIVLHVRHGARALDRDLRARDSGFPRDRTRASPPRSARRTPRPRRAAAAARAADRRRARR